MPRNSSSSGTAPASLDPRVVRSRAAVLGAAREILFAEGWDAVTHASVAARSGVGRTTLYRHWPEAADLIRDVIAEQLAITRIAPTGDLREDLIAQLEAFRLQLHDPGMERALRVIIERAGYLPAFTEMKETLYQEGSRGFREILRQAKAAGEVDARLDVGRAIDQLAGPLVYRRFLAGRSFTAAYVRHVVDDFLTAHAPRDPGAGTASP
ncbi:TetR/AcrR family transcriptional regulator [Yinghuangia aomiensis]|jgi:AcrR family transcriptional regulator|uniref:TetR/AcrR family transcriptional regulator n=1 Tax=Yinghuangia aomiensis TaxID=676205 RepID=A0ABP9I195_9ACTN